MEVVAPVDVVDMVDEALDDDGEDNGKDGPTAADNLGAPPVGNHARDEGDSNHMAAAAAEATAELAEGVADQLAHAVVESDQVESQRESVHHEAESETESVHVHGEAESLPFRPRQHWFRESRRRRRRRKEGGRHSSPWVPPLHRRSTPTGQRHRSRFPRSAQMCATEPKDFRRTCCTCTVCCRRTDDPFVRQGARRGSVLRCLPVTCSDWRAALPIRHILRQTH